MKWLVPAVLLLVVLTEACVAASPLRAFTLPITGVVVGTALGLLWGNLRSARADMPSPLLPAVRPTRRCADGMPAPRPESVGPNAPAAIGTGSCAR